MTLRATVILLVAAAFAGTAWGEPTAPPATQPTPAAAAPASAATQPAPAASAPASAPASAAATAPASPFKTDREKISYVVGMQIGGRIKAAGIELDMGAVAAGIRDTVAGVKPQLSQEEFLAAVQALQTQLAAKQAEAQATAAADEQKAADANQKAGDAFLAENAKKDGVKTTASGLQYKVLKAGTGKTPTAADTVSVKYRGTFINGKEFDATAEEPATFTVGGVIPGWTEALQLMKEGDKWQIVVPAKLGYGAHGDGRVVGPNEVLVFEIELLAVKPADPAGAPKK